MPHVSFEAAHTKSSQPPVPYPIYQGIAGQVGTMGFPHFLSAICGVLLWLVAALNVAAVIWFLPTLAGVLIAVFVFFISLAPSGIFLNLPYIEARREAWSGLLTGLFYACLAISLAASAALLYLIVYHSPGWPSFPSRPLEFHGYHIRPAGNIKADIATAEYKCQHFHDPYHCAWAPKLRDELADAQREIAKEVAFLEQQKKPKAEKPKEEPNVWNNEIVFLIGFLVLAAVHGLTAIAYPASSEGANAIWREPANGIPGMPKPRPILTIDARDDEDNGDAEDGFHSWREARVRIHEGTAPKTFQLPHIYNLYRKYAKDEGHPALAMPAFTAQMRKAYRAEFDGTKSRGLDIDTD